MLAYIPYMDPMGIINIPLLPHNPHQTMGEIERPRNPELDCAYKEFKATISAARLRRTVRYDM
jgi:hypothetical protein